MAVGTPITVTSATTIMEPSSSSSSHPTTTTAATTTATTKTTCIINMKKDGVVQVPVVTDTTPLPPQEQQQPQEQPQEEEEERGVPVKTTNKIMMAPTNMANSAAQAATAALVAKSNSKASQSSSSSLSLSMDNTSGMTMTMPMRTMTMTRAEVKEQADPDTKCLIIIGNKVYHATPRWQMNHPGGHLTLRAMSGKDATDAFYSTHPAFVYRGRGGGGGDDNNHKNNNGGGGGVGVLDKFFYAHLKEEEEEEKVDHDNDITIVEKHHPHQDAATLAFRELTTKLEDAGMFETDMNFYYTKMAIYIVMFQCVIAGVLWRTSSNNDNDNNNNDVWVHLGAGLLLGMFWQQMAFIGHDLGHNSVTHDRISDSYLGLFVGNLMTGVSIGWWKQSHNLHHLVTNSCDYDPDIQHLPVFAVDPAILKGDLYSTYSNRSLAVDSWTHLLVRHQHYLYYPVMMVARFNLYAQSFIHALGLSGTQQELVWKRHLQILSLIGFWTWLIALTMMLPNWTSRLVFFLPAHFVAGLLHVQITLSHFGMPVHTGVTYDDASNGFLRTQLRGSLSIDCPPWMDWFHGGLQFQVEHHLWPRLARHHLRTVRDLLMSLCREHGLEYNQATFVTANRLMLTKLRETANDAKSFNELFTDSINLSG